MIIAACGKPYGFSLLALLIPLCVRISMYITRCFNNSLSLLEIEIKYAFGSLTVSLVIVFLQNRLIPSEMIVVEIDTDIDYRSPYFNIPDEVQKPWNLIYLHKI
ncbi:hypothetical protein J3Q64DRAFT_1696136 [Phycomyces blakesleeanus]|uniref:Uncharacterized protein n=2 Tax=Phycomyces blakesleeanus TaxID=4837 RepID=A0A167R6E0_PHYB8|nr:hypothetical protein PHYBLDRAFT_161593 [Phycomyces blakesleeanus NRRL 1555(-)]OAD80957.1 hypothetical protein PHYBLDRAFT_161593 [Phycomyces blakesleeanus NRRL 1555(-)]|eukprot:XP_018298997.1 hypothetical protein PHYBLDRAFT_161593 [Phycomyces blakesleeanus NRRL 1555(-)]